MGDWALAQVYDAELLLKIAGAIFLLTAFQWSL